MSSTKGKGNGDYEYLRSAIEEKEHIEHVFSVVAYTTIHLGSRPSVMVVRSEVRENGQGLTQSPLCSLEGSWPNVNVVSWPAFLFQHYCKLSRLVEDSRRDEAAFWEGQKQAV